MEEDGRRRIRKTGRSILLRVAILVVLSVFAIVHFRSGTATISPTPAGWIAQPSNRSAVFLVWSRYGDDVYGTVTLDNASTCDSVDVQGTLVGRSLSLHAEATHAISARYGITATLTAAGLTVTSRPPLDGALSYSAGSQSQFAEIGASRHLFKCPTMAA